MWYIIFLWYIGVFGVIMISNLFTSRQQNKSYYKSLILPSIAPPPYVFGIMWFSLCILISTSGWIFQKHNNWDWSSTLTWMVVFVCVSGTFNFAFFVFKNNSLSFLIVTASAIFATITNYYLFHNYLLAGYLFLPTTIWICFATYLQLTILVNNDPEAIHQEKLLYQNCTQQTSSSSSNSVEFFC